MLVQSELIERRKRRSRRRYTIVGIMVIATALISAGRQSAIVEGVSGGTYEVPVQTKVWRSVGPALSIRFHTDNTSRSAVAAEAADLLPRFAAKADSTGVRYILLKAYNPIVQIGDLGIYRGWNFRYERTQAGWIASSYW